MPTQCFVNDYFTISCHVTNNSAEEKNVEFFIRTEEMQGVLVQGPIQIVSSQIFFNKSYFGKRRSSFDLND